MVTTSPTIGFAGDLSDPWVLGIARSLSGLAVTMFEWQGPAFPRQVFDPESGLKVLVLHRSRLSQADVLRLEELRRGLGPDHWPRIVMCVSPFIRYAELERCSGLVESFVSEATAAETLSRQIERMIQTPSRRTPRDVLPVEVVSTEYELRRMFREACTRAGYRATDASAPLTGPEAGDGRRITVWDVPVLEPRWEERLERRARMGPVVALLGFADRSLVASARRAGASACLDLPCAIDDLTDALDRLTWEESSRPRGEPAHATPPAPASWTARRPSSVLGSPVGDRRGS